MSQASQVVCAVMLAVVSAMWVLIGVLVTVQSDRTPAEEYYFRYDGVRFDGHSDRILDVQVSPDGRRLVSCAMDRTVRVWDAKTGTCLWICGGRFDKAEFSPNGQCVAGRDGRAITVWESQTGRFLRRLEGEPMIKAFLACDLTER